MGGLRFPFAAEVTLRCRDGRELGAARTHPAGSPGRPKEEIRALVTAKFRREAARRLSGKAIEGAVGMIDSLPSEAPVEGLVRSVSASEGSDRL